TLGNGSTSTATNPNICYNKAGVYPISLTVTTSKGCVSDTTIPNMITAYNHPKANFYYSPTDSITVLNPIVQFTDASYAPGSSIASVLWTTFGDGSDSTSTLPIVSHTYGDTGTYCPVLVVTNAFGCKDSTSKCLVVKPYFTLYIPNAFTPNGDNHDEIFNVVGDYISAFDMTIFDRWGNQIFHTTNVNAGWNGMKGNTPLQTDVYVYIINAVDMTSKPYTYKGTVTLLR
ncbi:MAG: gliding motility-associated C-terminal domain-containing protein, partial [Bacteroidetes bacterium]|nr:gliding motility-associated C-terminal domain-containing protein [Bacteroidota bacterium]